MSGGAAGASGARLPRRAVLLFAAVVLAKSLAWTVALPPWYGPDEPQHFDYLESLVVEGRPPLFAITRADGRDHPPEVACSQHNAGFRLNGAYFAQPPWLSDPDPCPAPVGPGSREAPVDTDAAAAYSPFYYVLGVPLWKAAAGAGVETRLMAARLVSVALGLVGALATLLAGWYAGGRRTAFAVAAGAVFAFQPMATQQFAIFNNDALVVALSAVFFWIAFRARDRGRFDAATGLALGLTTGVAYLAKPQGAYLAAPFALFAVAALRRSGPLRWLPPLAGFALPVLVLALFSRLLDLLLNGSLFSQVAVGGGHGGLRAYLAAYAGDGLGLLRWLWVVSAWGHFAWLDAVLPTAAFAVVAAAVLAGGLGLALAAGRGTARGGLLAAGAFLLLAGLLQLTELLFYRAHGGFVLQGRSFLVALPAGAIALVAGLTALAPARASGLVARAVTGAMLALLALSTAVVLGAFYG